MGGGKWHVPFVCPIIFAPMIIFEPLIFHAMRLCSIEHHGACKNSLKKNVQYVLKNLCQTRVLVSPLEPHHPFVLLVRGGRLVWWSNYESYDRSYMAWVFISSILRAIIWSCPASFYNLKNTFGPSQPMKTNEFGTSHSFVNFWYLSLPVKWRIWFFG